MILLRHGQSEFNLLFTATRKDPGIADPVLTEAGLAQARAAGEALRGEGVRRIVTSPYRRTLQTAEVVASVLRVPIGIDPLVRERYGFSCDIGSPVSALRSDWPQHDFSAVDEVWWPAEEEPVEGIISRANAFRATMAQAPDWTDVLVVSHWGFILSLTGKSVANGAWMRCDPAAPAPEEILWRHL
jgi:broad specificity phosphatase PhoE